MTKKLLILLLLLLTSCYNYTELNNLAIITAMGIDYNMDEYTVSIQVINTNETDEKKNFYTFEAKGKTLNEAINNLSLICQKRIMLSHLEILIYGENMAKHGINDTLDYLLRENNIRGDFLMLVAANTDASNIIKIDNPIHNINATSIKELNKTASYQTGMSITINFYDFMNNYLNEYIDNVMPSIKIMDDDKIIASDLAVFRGDKLTNYLDSEETIIYNILKNKAQEIMIDVPCKKGFIIINMHNIKTNIKKDMIKVKANGDIKAITCDLSLERNEDFAKINELVNNYLKEKIETFILKTKKNNTDIIGFKDIYYKNEHQYSNYKDLEYKTDVSVNLIGKGNTSKVVKNER